MNTETITHAQVQALVEQLSEAKLPIAYHLLRELADQEQPGVSQRNFARLSREEQRKIMAQQAEQMEAHYEGTAAERQEWQSGDFVDEY